MREFLSNLNSDQKKVLRLEALGLKSRIDELAELLNFEENADSTN
jgi:hypothetical protein